MSNPRKYFEHGELYLITSRTEEGLPFKDERLFSDWFDSILARALDLYPVELVAFDLEVNHLHLLLCAINPEHVPLFVGYVKQELSHAVNRMRGRVKKTIWGEGYDSPALLGESEAFYYLTYIYNQVRSRRTSLCNSWEMLTSGNYVKECTRRHRAEGVEYTEQKLILTLTPFRWLRRLGCEYTEEEAKAKLIEKVLNARKEGGVTPRDPPQPTKAQQAKDDAYIPKKRGRRMYCICWDKILRKEYLSFIKDSIERCKEVLASWRRGNFTDLWPLGFFPPNAIRRANLIPG